MNKRAFLRRLAWAGSAAFPLGRAWGQTGYPSNVIRCIVPFPAGGLTDAMVRVILTPVSKALGQPVIIENKPGAGGNLGMQIAAKSPPDGYTIALGTTSSMSVSPFLYKKLSFEATRDFTAVSMIGTTQNVLVVSKAMPVNNLSEFVAHVKANPAQVNYGSAGTGHSSHLGAEMLKRRLGIEMRHVPYKGGPEAMKDLIGGHVHAMVSTIANAVPHVKSGALKALVIAGTERSPALPGVPALPDVGIRNLSTDAWFGFVAPTGTQPEIVHRLHKEINLALGLPEVAAKLATLDITVTPRSVEAFGEFLKAEAAKWGEMVRLSGATLD